MNILLTGANGYIGERLIPPLLELGHTIYCCVRNRQRFEANHQHPHIHTVETDFLNPGKEVFPTGIDIAYYLIHSMSKGGSFENQEAASAHRFLELITPSQCRQIIYLGGIVNESKLSKHLSSRLNVEKILRNGPVPVTVLRAGIIVGSGSASFEIIRDLVEKLPIMITPKWLNTLCQPIGIRNVIHFLTGVINKSETYDCDYDICGPETMSYKQMLLEFGKVRGLKRYIFTLPIMTPRLSSYWLYFITSTSYPLAVNLVDSMKVNVVGRPNELAKLLNITLIPYRQSVEMAFDRIQQNEVLSSWKDAFIASGALQEMMHEVQVPTFGCYSDQKWREIKGDLAPVLHNFWSIGGDRGWYYGNRLWRLRGLVDKFFGGVGLRRGRTDPSVIHPGDALDFWRVLIADKISKRLLLFAEMKLPGEAWLEFRIMEKDDKFFLRQTATFRPRGLWGRIYWYIMLPFHYFIFNGMADNIVISYNTKSVNPLPAGRQGNPHS